MLHGRLRSVQRRLERYYELETTPDVRDFVVVGGEREQLLVKEVDDAVELALELPPPPANDETSTDFELQLIEGVSHFVYVAGRARIGLPSTRLELEIQAEVDKFVLLGLLRRQESKKASRQLRHRLFDRVRYLHPPGTEEGDRYRLANRLAAKVAENVSSLQSAAARRRLGRFYRAGQADKIRMARAAVAA